MDNLDKEFVLLSFGNLCWLKRCREGGWRRIQDTVVEKEAETRNPGRTMIDS